METPEAAEPLAEGCCSYDKRKAIHSVAEMGSKYRCVPQAALVAGSRALHADAEAASNYIHVVAAACSACGFQEAADRANHSPTSSAEDVGRSFRLVGGNSSGWEETERDETGIGAAAAPAAIMHVAGVDFVPCVITATTTAHIPQFFKDRIP